jgi:hypothetical protein
VATAVGRHRQEISLAAAGLLVAGAATGVVLLIRRERHRHRQH